MNLFDCISIFSAFLLLLCGGYFTLKSRLFPYSAPKKIFQSFFARNNQKQSPSGYSSFKAFATCLSGTVGVGNIVGVATAVVIGGSGVLLWIWVSALFSMILKYAEIYLSQSHRRCTNTEKNTGAMSYIYSAFKSKKVCGIYAVFFAVAMLLMGNIVQANAITEYIMMTGGAPKIIVSAVITAITAIFCFGKADRCISFLGTVAPAMTLLFVVGGIILIVNNKHVFFFELASVFRNAFSFRSAGGAAVFFAFSKGCMNGLFSNEAGLGSAAFAHGASNSKNAQSEGCWGILEVTVDTLVISTVTAFSIILTKTTSLFDAFGKQFGNVGKYFTVICVILFGISSVLSSSYYGKCCVVYVAKGLKKPYSIVFTILTFVAPFISASLAWKSAEMINCLLLFINCGAMFVLRKEIFKSIGYFFNNKHHKKCQKCQLTKAAKYDIL